MARIRTKILGEGHDPEYDLIFVDDIDHEKLLEFLIDINWEIEEYEDSVSPSEDDHVIVCCPNVDRNGYEWHFPSSSGKSGIFHALLTESDQFAREHRIDRDFRNWSRDMLMLFTLTYRD